MQPIIDVNLVSKKYRLGEKTGSKLHDKKGRNLLSNILYRYRTRKPDPAKLGPDEFWALKDVSFQVYPGEVLGLIGRNGSGKSTLLKILSRITYPTCGKIKIYGRVASLLEIGTGFNPELTGRENVFLNGTILGMTNQEIKRKFPKIVDFSGIEKFMDTPVKFYSSGMYTRLAFSVAAHLDAEILLIDEVLAVGDADFQLKSSNRIKEMTMREDRTVIFVSHNLTSIEELCHRAILIDTGRLSRYGNAHEVVKSYRTTMNINRPKITVNTEQIKETELQRWQLDRGDETLRVEYKLTPESVVFNVGGYQGKWTSDIFSRYLCQIHVFEPIIQNYTELQSRFKSNRNIHLYNFSQAQIVKFITSQKYKKIDLLQIYVEGMEYELLEPLIATKQIVNIKNILVHFNLSIPNSRKRRVLTQKMLRKTHKLTFDYPFVWENWERIET